MSAVKDLHERLFELLPGPGHRGVCADVLAFQVDVDIFTVREALGWMREVGDHVATRVGEDGVRRWMLAPAPTAVDELQAREAVPHAA